MRDIGFGAHTTLGYTRYDSNSGGVLTASDGAHLARIALLGQYAAGALQDYLSCVGAQFRRLPILRRCTISITFETKRIFGVNRCHQQNTGRPGSGAKVSACNQRAEGLPNIVASARARSRSNVRRCIPFGLAGNGSSKSTPPPSLILIFRACSKPRCHAVCCWLA